MNADEWRYKYIDDPAQAFSESGQYLTAMEVVFALPGSKDAAIFSRFDTASGGMHYYFTPQARAVAVQFGASPCEKPLRDKIGGLLAGDMTLIGRLYS